MDCSTLLGMARRDAGLTVSELARRAAVPRANLSAYEHGRKTPTVVTLQRILHATGHDLQLAPRITFSEVPTYRGRVVTVPSRLPRGAARGSVTLPITVQWSGKDRTYDLDDPAERKAAYEAVMTNGGPAEVERFIDADLLLDIWDEMYLPPATRAAWAPVVEAERAVK